MNKIQKKIIRPFLPRKVKPHLILRGPLRGMQIVTSWYHYPGAILGRTERYLLDWFDRNIQKGETWIDVGAHYGYTAVALCRLVGQDGRVFAFEPVLSTAGHLNSTREINGFPQLFILPFALSDSPDLRIVRMRAGRGMVYTSPLGKRMRENVITVSFDAIWNKICGEQPQIHGFKIDVEGMEIKVLRGMSEMVKKFFPKLIIEIHPGVDRTELFDLIESLGYSRDALPIDPSVNITNGIYPDIISYYFTPL